MAFNKYVNGAWQEADGAKRYASGAWTDCDNAYRYESGAWEEALEVEPLYLIKNGAYQVAFTEIPLWKNMTDSTVTQKPSNGYVEIVTDGLDMRAIITTDEINLKRYKQINIEADAQIYLGSSSYENHAVTGVYSELPATIATGDKATVRDECLLYNKFYTMTGKITTVFNTANATVDISGIKQDGHVFMGITSWNLNTEYSKLRIKNLWLS